MTIEQAAAEVIAAYREHEAFLMVGGHSPQRVDAAINELEKSLVDIRNPADV